MNVRSAAFAVRYTLYVLAVTIACFGCLNALLLARAYAITRFYPAAGDVRYTYPNYRGTDWAATHFKEFRALKTEYRSFVGWRRKGFSGETINVDSKYGIRRSLGHKFDGAVYFLGGSTVWGTGANDATTIPSLFHVATRQSVLNLGESGYTTRQSLDALLNMMSYGHMPSAVISYEGLNDVGVNCRHDVALVPAHDLERQFNHEVLQDAPAKLVSVVGHFFTLFPAALKARFFPPAPITETFDCASNAAKRRRVAQNIVDNWNFMEAICQKKGIRFFAVLQPSLFSATSRVDHLPSEEFATRGEFDAVYPLVRDLAQTQCASGDCGVFTDLSQYDFGDQYVFIDNAHLSPNGNWLIATALAKAFDGR